MADIDQFGPRIEWILVGRGEGLAKSQKPALYSVKIVEKRREACGSVGKIHASMQGLRRGVLRIRCPSSADAIPA